MIRLLPLLMLAGCQSMPAMSCDNASTIRTAAEATIRMVDRVCPIR
jgi:hypothetical protein